MASGDRLDEIRAAIDALDDELLRLLNRRASLVEEVAELKQAEGRGFYVPARERAIIDRLQEANPGPFPAEAIRPVFQEIISACLSLEKGVRVAFLGPEATFTHQAVKRHFGTSAVTMPCGSIGAVFDEVGRGQAEFGVVPVENSSEGVVNHTLDSFMDTDLSIRAEIVVSVDHCLMARPGVGESGIERVYSHPQALAQCRQWLTANLSRVTLVECPSTTDAARRALEDVTGAAIGAELAARVYGLSVLRQKLQDTVHNVTRFLVVGRGEPEAPVSGRDYKTTLLLVLGDRPGDLYRVLEPLSAAGINLTKIESRPSRRKPWEYVFFIDMEGHAADERLAPVLAEMSDISELKVLGSYRKADEI